MKRIKPLIDINHLKAEESLNCSMRLKAAFITGALILSFWSVNSFAQTAYTGIVAGPPKFHKHLELSSAFSYSVINNRKEVRGQYKPGINFGLHYATRSWFTWSAEYSDFFKHNSSPGFENIKSWNAELNGNFSFGMATSDLKFRFVFGMCYLNWSGTFVGPNANDNRSWYYGKVIDQNWVGANLGFGFAHPIGRSFTGNIDFRSRFASEKRDLISISDTAFLFGIKWNPSKTKSSIEKDSKAHKKTNTQKPARTYKWLKKRVS